MNSEKFSHSFLLQYSTRNCKKKILLLIESAGLRDLQKNHYDAIVIGSGPAGQKAAIQVAKLGKHCALIEKNSHPGGNSLTSGTIPSKTLREAILDLTGFYKRSFYGKEALNFEITIKDLTYRLHYVLNLQREVLNRQLNKNNIDLINGEAKFLDPHRLEVLLANNQGKKILQADRIIIATGSKPRNPTNVPFDQQTILDSTRLLGIDHVPESLLVLGGGVIGSEYASFFAALGTKVSVVDKRDRMLPLLDREVGIHFLNAMRDLGVEFIGEKEVVKIEKQQGKAFVEFSDKSSIQAEMLLFALGRTANIEALEVENAEIELEEKKYIKINPLFQTSQPHIYAAGDVIGGPCLASTSMEQGRLAARHAFGSISHYENLFYPLGIYTIPEISCIGYTEEQLKEKRFHYEVGRAYYYEIAKNQIAGGDSGLFKILFHGDTREILGIHIVGRNATELIHIGQVAMSFNARIDYFIDQVFNYPTYAEGYRIAALNGVNKL